MEKNHCVATKIQKVNILDNETTRYNFLQVLQSNKTTTTKVISPELSCQLPVSKTKLGVFCLDSLSSEQKICNADKIMSGLWGEIPNVPEVDSGIAALEREELTKPRAIEPEGPPLYQPSSRHYPPSNE